MQSTLINPTTAATASSATLAADHPCNTSRDSCGSVDDPRDCSTTSSVLDTMNTCINCVEGVEVQRAFDDQWTFLHPMIDLDDDETNPELGLLESGANIGDEAIETSTLIRLQLMEDQTSLVRSSQHSSIAPTSTIVPDFDVLNLCGGADSDDVGVPASVATSADVPGANSPALLMPSCGTYAACPRLDKAVDTTVDTAQTADVDNSFLSVSTIHEAGGDATNDHDDPEEVLAQCSVCLHEGFAGRSVGGSIACLPCCGHHMCWPCVGALTVPVARESDGDSGCRAGRCPCCRSWIVVEEKSNSEYDGGGDASQRLVHRPLPTIHLVSVAGKCQECCQIKQLLVDGSVCDACVVSRQLPPLAYECDCCQHVQRISHPLYRYQVSPESFGTVGWQCNACNQVSRWRIRPDQIPMMLVGDAPAEWNDNIMEKARVRVQIVRSGDHLSDLARHRTQPSSLTELAVASPSSCIIV